MNNYSFILPEFNILPAYVPGKAIFEVQKEFALKKVVKMASNENPFGPSPKVKKIIADNIDNLAIYPDAQGLYLKEQLAEKFNHPVPGIVLGNGSSDFLQIFPRIFLRPGFTAIMSKPSFSLYRLNTIISGATALEIPLNEEFQHDLDKIIATAHQKKAKLVFLDNPLNPTGSYLEGSKINKLVDDLPKDCILVLDEAYIDFSSEKRPDYQKILEKGNRLIVIRTFSKVYGLAALRLGYALMNPELAELINKVRQPFNTGQLSQIAAGVALKDDEHFKKIVKYNKEALVYLKDELEKLNMTTYPSQANFLMVQTKQKANIIFENLLKLGFIIRPLGSFFLENHIRITTSTPENNENFIKAFKKVI